MGRAIGLFLLVMGIGLAAYGLSDSENEPTRANAGYAATATGESVAERGPTPADDRSKAVEERSRANGSQARIRVPAPQPAVQPDSPLLAASNAPAPGANRPVLAPMEKLRAAANARALTSTEEPAVNAQPSPSNSIPASTPPDRGPVEPAADMRPAPPAPAVIARARREAGYAAGTPGATGASKTRTGWTTTVAGGPPTRPVPLQTTTIAVPVGHPAGAVLVRSAVASQVPKSRFDTDPDSTRIGATPGSGGRDVGPEPAADGSSAISGQKTQMAQRYSPPVYLGRPVAPATTTTYMPPFSSGGGSAVPRRTFKSQDMWERQRRDGM